MYTYKVFQNPDGTYGYDILNDSGELIIHQPFDPSTGKGYPTDTDAETAAKALVDEMNQFELETLKPYLEVKFLDANGNPVTLAKVGDPITVNVELYFEDSEGNKTYAPVTGTYIVPYYIVDSDQLAGTAVITIENGQGSGVIKFDKSGIFEIKLDKVLNAETMQQPDPLPILKSNPRIVIAEPVEQTTTEDTTTS